MSKPRVCEDFVSLLDVTVQMQKALPPGSWLHCRHGRCLHKQIQCERTRLQLSANIWVSIALPLLYISINNQSSMKFLKHNVCHQIKHACLALSCYSLGKPRAHAMNTETGTDWIITEVVFPTSRCCQFLKRYCSGLLGNIAH